MQQILVNNTNIRIEVKEDQTINELMDEIQLKQENLMFTSVKLNGIIVPEETEAQLLQDLVSNYESIEFEMKSQNEIAFDVLNISSKYIDIVIDKIKIAVKLYHQDEIVEASSEFAEITEILDLFIQLMTTIHQTIDVKKDLKLDSGKALYDLEIHLLSVLKSLIPAHEKNDIIMLCDLLEYELIDNLTQWKISVIPKLKKLQQV